MQMISTSYPHGVEIFGIVLKNFSFFLNFTVYIKHVAKNPAQPLSVQEGQFPVRTPIHRDSSFISRTQPESKTTVYTQAC